MPVLDVMLHQFAGMLDDALRVHLANDSQAGLRKFNEPHPGPFWACVAYFFPQNPDDNARSVLIWESLDLFFFLISNIKPIKPLDQTLGLCDDRDETGDLFLRSAHLPRSSRVEWRIF
jgi:hypothetical protein